MKGRMMLTHLLGAPLTVLPERIPLVVAALLRISAGEEIDPLVAKAIKAEQEVTAARASRVGASVGSIAVVPLYGYMQQRPVMDISGGGGASCMEVGAAIQAAVADDSVASILLDIDSPGGEVYGVQELGATVAAANQKKPVVAIANSMACSGAYWVGSQAGEFYTAPGGITGSIGCYTMHKDLSKALEAEGVTMTLVKAGKFKGEFNPLAALSDDDREALQSLVDSYYSKFVTAVASGRKTSQKAVREGYGQGRGLVDDDAVAAGLVDGVMTYSAVLSKMAARNKRAGGGTRSLQQTRNDAAAFAALNKG